LKANPELGSEGLERAAETGGALGLFARVKGDVAVQRVDEDRPWRRRCGEQLLHDASCKWRLASR
jgi:hypothetical protein